MIKKSHSVNPRARISQLTGLIALCFSLVASAQTGLPNDARSVHLSYIPGESAAFYNEVEITESQRGTYFMAIGFNGGYFGIQQLVEGGGLVIFSLWDDTKESDRSKVAESDQAKALTVGENVFSVPFGNEGIGISARMPYTWQEGHGSLFYFYVSTEVKANRTSYSAYFATENSDWQLIAIMDRPAGGSRLAGLYSFVEDFRRDGNDTSVAVEQRSPNQRRAAVFANPWAQQPDSSWSAINTVKFTAWGPHELNSINATVTNPPDGVGFSLETGGDTVQTTDLNSQLVSLPVLQSVPDIPGN
jgi:hypothetical protein